MKTFFKTLAIFLVILALFSGLIWLVMNFGDYLLMAILGVVALLVLKLFWVIAHVIVTSED